MRHRPPAICDVAMYAYARGEGKGGTRRGIPQLQIGEGDIAEREHLCGRGASGLTHVRKIHLGPAWGRKHEVEIWACMIAYWNAVLRVAKDKKEYWNDIATNDINRNS